MSNVPWFMPGIVVSIAAALVLAVPLGRALAVRPALAGALVLCLGIILSATVTPFRDALEAGAIGTGVCDFSGLDSTPLDGPRLRNDRTLNVLLFIPLGLVLGLLPPSWRTAAAITGSIALPFGIESIQLVVRFLARGCQVVDVVDNLTGLAIGIAVGVALRLALRRT